MSSLWFPVFSSRQRHGQAPLVLLPGVGLSRMEVLLWLMKKSGQREDVSAAGSTAIAPTDFCLAFIGIRTALSTGTVTTSIWVASTMVAPSSPTETRSNQAAVSVNRKSDIAARAS